VIKWNKVKPLKADLEAQRKTIVDIVAADDPKEGFELIWQFLALADPIFERSDDDSGVLMESFHRAGIDAGVVAKAAGIKPDVLADKIFAAVRDNGHGQFDRLITAMVAALGTRGLERLKALFVQWSQELAESPAEVIGRNSMEPPDWGDLDGIHGEMTVRIALQEIADIEGDVDAYIALQPEGTRKAPLVAADIAGRLRSAGRAAEALRTLDAVETGHRTDGPVEWQLARIETLEALGRADEAQAQRWTWFEQSLSDLHLRAFLKRLPDFDDIEAEEKAFAYVQAFPDIHQALAFALRWPALDKAAELVIERRPELDGNRYELMTLAAEALAEKHPLAATLALRSMIDFTLDNGRSSRYKHAARHLAQCASLAPRILDFKNTASHAAYIAELKRRHGKKLTGPPIYG
jgi:hypothetical protein